MGLRSTPELDEALGEAQRTFVRAATSTDRPEVSLAAAQTCLQAATRAGDLLMEAYTTQILQSRLLATSRLPTHLGCVMDVLPPKLPSSASTGPRRSTRARSAYPGGRSLPPRGSTRWDLFDAQLAWCRRNNWPSRPGR